MASAASRTFAIPELLEQVLLELVNDGRYITPTQRMPAIHIFGLKRVCKDFNSIIDDSPALLRRMREAPTELSPLRPDFVGSYDWRQMKHLSHETQQIRIAWNEAKKSGARNESWRTIETCPEKAQDVRPSLFFDVYHVGLFQIQFKPGLTFGDVFDIVETERAMMIQFKAPCYRSYGA